MGTVEAVAVAAAGVEERRRGAEESVEPNAFLPSPLHPELCGHVGMEAGSMLNLPVKLAAVKSTYDSLKCTLKAAKGPLEPTGSMDEKKGRGAWPLVST